MRPVLWYIHTARERDWNLYKHQRASTVACRNARNGIDRDQDPGFPVVPVLFPVPIPVRFPCSVNKPVAGQPQRQQYALVTS